MRKYRLSAFFAMLSVLCAEAAAQSHEQFDPDLARRLAFEAELVGLEHEIGRFSSGATTVYSGELTVAQHGRGQAAAADGDVLAWMSPTAPSALTIVFVNSGRWLRLSQDSDDPAMTDVTRLLAAPSTGGVRASCRDCAPALADVDGGPLLLRLAAEGELLDIRRSRFGVALAGHLEPVPARALGLEQILSLRPDLDSWLRRPAAPFRPAGAEALRDVASVLRQPAPAPGGDAQRFTCAFETAYTARHYVDRRDLTRFGVRDLVLGETDLCCVDHASHDGAKVCDGEFGR